MANITREYETNKVIKMMITCEDGTDYVDIINNGEDKGNYKYSLIDNPDDVHPYIELLITELEYCYSTSSIRRKYKMTSQSIAPRYVFSSVSNDDLIEGKACFFTNTISSTISSKTNSPSGTYVSPVLQSNIDDTTGKKVWGIIFQDSTGHNNIIQGGTTANVAIPYVSIQGGGNPGTMYQSIISMLAGWQSATSKCIGQIKSTLPIASSLSGALKYINNGDESELLNGGGEEVAERNIDTLYLKSTVYRSVTSSRTQAVKVESHRWEFDVQRYTDDGKQIAKWNRGVIGFVNDTNTGHYNLGFMENTATKNLVKIRVDGVEVPKTTFSWLTGLTTYTENTKDVIEDQTYFYWSDISTNMYIFDTLYNAQQAIQGIEDGIVKMFEGDDLTNTHLNDNDLDFNTDMSDCFVLDQADVQALARRFNAYVTSDGSIISDLFVGLGIHENPIDCNIDLFEMPIDVSGFCETEHYIVKFSPRVTRNPDPERQPEE